MRKSRISALQEPDLSFLFSKFFVAFSASENGSVFSHSPELDSGPVYEDYLQKGERLISLAKEKFTKVVGKIQLSDSEEKIFSSAFAENDSLYDIATKIARVFTRPLLKSIGELDDEFATKLIETISMPSLKVSFAYPDPEMENSFLVRLRGTFEKHKKKDAKLIKLWLKEDGFSPLLIYGALNHTHPDSLKNIVFDTGCCVADLGLLTAYLIIYKQLSTTFELLRNAEDEVDDTIAAAFHEKMQTYEKNFIKNHFYAVPDNCTPLLDRLSIEEVFSHPVHIIGVEKGYVPPFATDFMALQGLEFIDHPSYGACSKAMLQANHSKNVQFRFYSGFSQLCFAYFLKCHIPFHYFLIQFKHMGGMYWKALPDITSNHTKKAAESTGMKLLADLFRVIAFQKHSQHQMISYYQDLEKTYAKSYMLKKSTTQKTQKAMALSRFNDYFGFVEFDVDTDLSKVEEIALEFKAVKETYFPSIDAKANAIRFRKLGQHKALGLYYPSLACLCVDIHSPSSLIHEFGHLIDYCYGRLSEKKDFATVRTLYVEHFDNALEKDKALQKKMKSGSKYNRAYYTMPTEIFARCFELYVSQCLEVRNSIVPSTFQDSGIYPANAKMLNEISRYFSSLPFVRAERAEKELKCANA